jgi:hypothetical protein
MQPQFTPLATPPRSMIPRVIGILAIIFSMFGMGASLLWSYGTLHDVHRFALEGRLGFVTSWLYLWAVLSGILFLVHLGGGILACMNKLSGLRLLTGYAVGALVLLVIDMVILNGFVTGKRSFESITAPRIVFSALAAPWPIVVLALVNGRRARAACS